jgi:DNA-binding NarL/FixJ family response regulator
MQPMNVPQVLLISSDLMASSRLAGAVRSVGAELETLAGAAGVPRAGGFDIVLLDLQSLAADPASLVARARELGGPAAKVVAFGPHVWQDRLDAAVAAGADETVSRGAMMGDVAAVIRRWTQT